MGKKQLDDRLQNLPDCVAKYIRLVIKKMGYRRKVRMDVQAELAAHFEDELKNCADEQEKNQKARQLITEFGDVKMLGILLRRAKKRCRPLWRTVVARSFQTVGVLILCFIIYVVWFFSGRPVITKNYIAELNRIVRPQADESLNAAPLYEKAIASYKELSDDFIVYFVQHYQDEYFARDLKELASEIKNLPLYKASPELLAKKDRVQKNVFKIIAPFLGKNFNELDKLNDEEIELVKRWVQEHSDALEFVTEGSRKPYYWRTYESGSSRSDEMLGILFPDLANFRALFQVMRWRIWLNAREGRFEDVFNDIITCYRLGQNLRGDKTLIEQLVGMAIESASVQIVWDILSGYEIYAKELADFQHNFEKIVVNENFTLHFNGERLFLYDEIQRCFTSDGLGGGHLYVPRLMSISRSGGGYEDIQWFTNGLSGLRYCSHIIFWGPNRDETLKKGNKFYDYLDKLSLQSAAQLHSQNHDIDRTINKLFSENIFLSLLTSAGVRVIEISNRVSTEVGAAVAILALSMYKQDKGRYPVDLDELVTGKYLKQLPMDSFSDKPLVYGTTDNNFILYSYGSNCVDDGGKKKIDDEGKVSLWSDDDVDAVFWPQLKD